VPSEDAPNLKEVTLKVETKLATEGGSAAAVILRNFDSSAVQRGEESAKDIRATVDRTSYDERTGSKRKVCTTGGTSDSEREGLLGEEQLRCDDF
jgi:hypothetical protein